MVHLKREPQTEEEYWEIIEALGGLRWRLNHDLADGRIHDPDGSADQTIREAGELQLRLLSEIKEKYGVVLPEGTSPLADASGLPELPVGKIYYRDWYYTVREQVTRKAFERIICSACPFSGGIEKYVAYGGNQIPCRLFHGSLYQLHRPHECAVVSPPWNRMSHDDLLQRIAEETGDEGVRMFLSKAESLQGES